MLKLFEVSGFKNFKDTVRLDFSDIRDYKFNPQCITNGLIGKAIIYGKNSIGKSNFGLAVFDIVSHLSTKMSAPTSMTTISMSPLWMITLLFTMFFNLITT